jgi:hypothetical protein
MSADHIYIDLLKSYSEGDRSANIFYQYNSSIIKRPVDYTVSIDRFNIPLNSLPIFIMNLTASYYNVELEYNGFSSGVIPVSYVPVPAPYYNPKVNGYIWSHSEFITYINTALATAYTTLAGLTALPAGSAAPYVYIDNNSTLTLKCPTPYLTSAAIPIKIYASGSMFRFLTGLQFDYTTSAIVANRNILMRIYDLKNNSETIAGVVWYSMHSDYKIETLVNWNDPIGIIFTSNHITSRPEIIPVASPISGSGTITQNGQNILANFDFIYGQTPKPLTVQYVLQSPYKKIDLIGTDDINKIDINVYWYDSEYNLYPISLYPNDSISVRLCFIKKKVEI